MSRIPRIWAHLRLWWRASRWMTVAMVAFILLPPAVFYASIMAQAALINALVAGTTWEHATKLLLVVVLLLIAPTFLTRLTGLVRMHFQPRYMALFQTMLAEAALHPHGIEALEDPEISGQLKNLSTESRAWYSFYSIEMTANIFGLRLTGLMAVFIVARWNLWCALGVAVVTIFSAQYSMRYLKDITDRFLDTSSANRQKAEYLRRIPTERAAGKEVRLFNLTHHFTRQYAQQWLASMTTLWATRRRQFWPAIAAYAVAFAIQAAVLAFLVHDALRDAITVGILVATIQGLLRIGNLGSMNDSVIHVTRAEAYATQLAKLRTNAGLPVVPPRGSWPDIPAALFEGNPLPRAASIHMENVSFTYPSREDPVLSNLNVDIEAGQHVAIVGVNGAGKSTLIKLLTGMYTPSSGTIRIDGVDPRTSDAARRRVAVVFQDFVRYELSLRDNIALGVGSQHLHDLGKIQGSLPSATSKTTEVGGTGVEGIAERALHDAAGDSILERVDGNWDTILATGYEGGTDLSGGQWQRVALARAFAAAMAGAGVLVLDEPTAALDVRAEAELFERFLDVTGGITSILISHRLSSVRKADRIIVLDSGGAIEDGTHDELLALGGHYAEMFTLQAARFAQSGSADEEDSDV